MAHTPSTAAHMALDHTSVAGVSSTLPCGLGEALVRWEKVRESLHAYFSKWQLTKLTWDMNPVNVLRAWGEEVAAFQRVLELAQSLGGPLLPTPAAAVDGAATTSVSVFPAWEHAIRCYDRRAFLLEVEELIAKAKHRPAPARATTAHMSASPAWLYARQCYDARGWLSHSLLMEIDKLIVAARQKLSDPTARD